MNTEVKTDVSGKWVARENVDAIVKSTVQECIDILNDQKNYNRCMYTTSDLDRAKCVTSELIKTIKQRFEIK
jgi:hypothetical protein